MNNLSLLSWNIRGASNETSRASVKTVIQDTKASIVCFQETKTRKWSDSSIKRLGVSDSTGWVESPSLGLSGGLLSNVVEIVSFESSRHWLLIKGICLFSRSPFACLNIYAPQSPEDKLVLWQDLSNQLRQLEGTPLALIGDFNCVRRSSERENCLYRKLDSVAFEDFIQSNDFLEVVLSNENYP